MITIESITPGNEPQEMKKSEIFMTLISGVGFPSWDVYSDIAMSAMLINSGESRALFFGWLILVPVVLSTIFQIPHWWKIERNMKRRAVTLPLLLCQFWPQSRMLQLAFLGWKKDKNWMQEKKYLQKYVTSIGNHTILNNRNLKFSFSSQFTGR